ncbi:MAG: helix-turn-helix domain-containing protein [Nanoarchaeota archaeon]
MNIEPLEEIGLTKAEIKVYLALLELGLTTAGGIIRKSGLQSSVVHNSINNLVKKGFVSYILKGKIKHYQTIDPRNINEFIENKKRKFNEILPELILKQKLGKVRTETYAEVYEGSKGLFNALIETIKDAKPKEEYLFFAVGIEHPDAQRFFERYDHTRKLKHLVVKGVADVSLRPVLAERQRKKLLDARYVDFPIPIGMTIFRDEIIIIDWGEKPVGMLIRSKQIANNYRKLFYDIWNKGKK